MSEENQTPPEIKYRQPGAFDHEHKNWFALHHLAAYALFGMLGLAIVAGVAYYQVKKSVYNYVAPPVNHGQVGGVSIYSNPTQGFEFKYPKNETFDEDDGAVVFISSEDKTASAVINMSFDKGTISEFIRKMTSTPGTKIMKDEVRKIGTHDWRIVQDVIDQGKDSELQFYTAFLEKDGYVYIFSTKNIQTRISVLEQMLATFKLKTEIDYGGGTPTGDNSGSNQENSGGTLPARGEENGEPCIQVITWARNPQTGETKQFPTPCDVPDGWEVTSSGSEAY